ncbi:hypothetical protein Y032_0087g2031 [Ancylostoma ceylanicum]|uniref:SCP domain-containing protein n=1 Tax=Ancylostoma ceylanicum TaxID=53326 RepID=A0A016TP01_9BILA|nr:hypothetical protein Y032_0087g2031 [Ancylostoma ceylanicum]
MGQQTVESPIISPSTGSRLRTPFDTPSPLSRRKTAKNQRSRCNRSYGFEGPVNTDIIKTVFANGLDGIDQFILEGVSSNKVIYKSDTVDGLRLYVNVIRPKATEIGCALTKCKDEGDPFAIYCIMNAKKLNGGDIVYEA